MGDTSVSIGRALCLLLCACGVRAQTPEIARNGIVNAAGQIPLALNGSAIARGALLHIQGSHFAAGATAKLSGPAGSSPLTIVFAGAGLVVARVSPRTPLGPAALTVTVNGHASRPVAVNVVAAQFGIYSTNRQGWGPARTQDTARSATFGQTVTLLGTGLGDEKNPSVWVGGRPARVVGVRSTSEGDEIRFQIPGDAPEGCFVPVQVQHAGSLPSNTVTLSIRRGGGDCIQPEYFPFAGWPNARFGLVVVSRTVQREQGPQPVTDEVGGWFGRLPGLDRLNPYFLLPPPGTCTSHAEAWHGESLPGSFVPRLVSHTGAKALRAGDELAIDDGRTVRKVPAYHGTEGVYDRQLSDLIGRADRLFHLLSPAVIHVTAKGGTDVGRFGFALPGVRPFEVRGTMGPLRRGRPLRLEWADMDAGSIAVIIASFADDATGTRGMCYCVARPGATGLTIPATALAYFPPAGNAAGLSLTIAAWPLRPADFQAAGLDHALAVSTFLQASGGKE